MPLRFEDISTEDLSAFFSRGAGYGITVTATEATITLVKPTGNDNAARDALSKFDMTDLPAPEIETITLKIVGGNSQAQAVPLDQLATKVNYLLGNDASQWRTNVATYGQVVYESVYEGIDLVYYGTAQGQLQYDFVVGPGANPDDIRVAIKGGDVELGRDGKLLLHTSNGTIVQNAPVLYQEIDGKLYEVEGKFKLHADGQVGFAVGDYDKSRALIIDPVVTYARYLGGNGWDNPTSTIADSKGNVFVAGFTTSTNLPASGFQSTKKTGYDGFVYKIASDGSMEWVTYQGGNGNDFIYAMTQDEAGDLYLAGGTHSTDIASAGAFDTTKSGGRDGYVFKLSADGATRKWASYYGGDQNDQLHGIAVQEGTGIVFVAGQTQSSDSTFPLVNAYQATRSGVSDATIASFFADGSDVYYSTLFGGAAGDTATGLDLDSNGNAIIAGYTDTASNGTDMFVAKFIYTGTGNVSLGYATTLGDAYTEVATGVAVDQLDRPVIVGYSASYGSPNNFLSTISPTSFQGGSIMGSDAVVARFDSSGALDFARFIGGTDDDEANGVAVDAAGNIYVLGTTYSDDLESIQATQEDLSGQSDAFLTFINAPATDIVYQSYLGGSNYDFATALAVNAVGSAFVTGFTYGSFPTENDPDETSFGGGFADGFLAAINVPLAVKTTTSRPVTTNPTGDWLLQQGASIITTSLYLNNNACPCSCIGPTTANYNSAEVNPTPVFQISIQTDANAPVPDEFEIQLTWDGGTPQTATLNGSIFNPGELITYAMQLDDPVTATGRYEWEITVTHVDPTWTNEVVQTFSGVADIVVRNDSPLGVGWALGMINKLFE
ncbi:MAG: SBBP repeat-containing protein, partial [Gemmataceae bacterium]